ncbi:uncharacterized protein BDW43DRAFT_270597 [Aspergillus alliaceus]|uniref:uncharacterized protein n=1 Tax=Petromyces alliaceus TaxID=209559 RepID=UPI0012A4E81A|nr:uncharacterized protein BDW43DRAFT_270597 [Aspergillus alliaceus]KAB8235534.1 hypothetical protein BDW43DRAFT_270597 [Aspergillus alliaceus]
MLSLPLGGSTGSRRRRGPTKWCLLLFFASTLASWLLIWVLKVSLRIIFPFVIILDLS